MNEAAVIDTPLVEKNPAGSSHETDVSWKSKKMLTLRKKLLEAGADEGEIPAVVTAFEKNLIARVVAARMDKISGKVDGEEEKLIKKENEEQLASEIDNGKIQVKAWDLFPTYYQEAKKDNGEGLKVWINILRGLLVAMAGMEKIAGRRDPQAVYGMRLERLTIKAEIRVIEAVVRLVQKEEKEGKRIPFSLEGEIVSFAENEITKTRKQLAAIQNDDSPAAGAFRASLETHLQEWQWRRDRAGRPLELSKNPYVLEVEKQQPIVPLHLLSPLSALKYAAQKITGTGRKTSEVPVRS